MVDFTLQITVQGIAFDVFVGSQYVLNGFRRSILFETTLDFLQVFFGERLCKTPKQARKRVVVIKVFFIVSVFELKITDGLLRHRQLLQPPLRLHSSSGAGERF